MSITLTKVLPFFFDKIVEKVSEATPQHTKSSPDQIQNILPINTFMAKEWRRLGYDDGQNYGTNEFFVAQKNMMFEGFQSAVVESIYLLYRFRLREETFVRQAGELEQESKEKGLANIRFLRILTLRYLSYRKVKLDDPKTEFAKCWAEYKGGYIAGRHDDSKRQSMYKNEVNIFPN